MFEVEYLWNGWVKKDEVNVNAVLCLYISINFACSPRLTKSLPTNLRHDFIKSCHGAELCGFVLKLQLKANEEQS